MSKILPSLFLTAVAISFSAFSLEAAQPQLSVSPMSGSGQAQTFTLTATDSDGAGDIGFLTLMFNSVFDGSSGCWLSWNNHEGAAYLNTSGLQWLYLPVATTLENSRCSVQFLSAATSGNSVSVSFNVTFNGSLTGTQTVWAQANTSSGPQTGYLQLGTWTVPSAQPAPDFQVSMTPANQTVIAGNSATYNVSVTSLNGFTGNLQFTAAPLVAATGVTVAAFGTNNSSLIFVPAGGTGTGAIQVTTDSSATPGNVTITTGLFAGALLHTAAASLGITAPVSSSPGPGLLVTHTTIVSTLESFVISATDPAGYAAIGGMDFLIDTSLNGQNACWLNFTPAQNGGGTLSLASNDANSWTSMPIPAPSGANPSLQNTQCQTVFAPTVKASGNTLTLSVTLQISPALRGSLVMYADATGSRGDSGYQTMGSFTLAGGTGPDFVIGTTPGPQSISAGRDASWQVNIDGRDGYTGAPTIGVTGLPADTTLNIPSTSVHAGQWTGFTVTTATDTPAGTYTLTITATDGTLTHTVNVTLTVLSADLPTLQVGVSSTPALTRLLFLMATNPWAEGAAPAGLNALIANSVDGRNACWFYYTSAGQLMLASDDGLSWLAADSSRSVANSQCSVTYLNESSSTTLAVSANVTLLGQFAAGNKNVYMSSFNQAGNTGYQFKGTWTVP